ncbi:MAG TPA: M1 family aminopeptidase [Gemmatimonadales bacterium]|nr:M1 family aminopeptidase [Gemmatimonadales bacterium]
MSAVAVAVVVAVLSPMQTPYDTVFDQVKNLKPTTSVAAVKNIVLRRDVMELQLDSGHAYLLTPIGGRTIGIAFVGNGSVSFVPPLDIERFNLNRVLGDSSLNDPISAAVLIFVDSTADELRRQLKFEPTGTPGAAAGAVNDALDYLVDGRSRSGDATLLGSVLNGTSSAYFNAYVQRKRGESVLIQFDPTLEEEVLLLRRGKMLGQRTETVCQFQREADLRDGVSITSKQPEPITVHSYDIDARIDGNYKFSASTTVTVSARAERQQWVRFSLYSELDIDSVLNETGAPLTYYRRDTWSPLWIRFPEPLAPGKPQSFRVVYHGSLIGFGSALPDVFDAQRRDFKTVLDSWAYIKNTTTWYPRYAGNGVYDVKLTFRTPKALKFASIGRLVQADTQGNTIVSKWVSELPTNQVSFNIGEFQEFPVRDSRIPPVTVQINTRAHELIHQYLPSSRSALQDVGTDVVNSLSFFSNTFGAPLFSSYYATEIPYFHGQAFPGMIHLSWSTFLGLSDKGEDESFRAHEMAHQWFGIGVEPAGDRDAWLSEGFSEFAGMWFMQLILQDNDKYFKMLRESRKEIRGQRGKSMPLGLGYRALESWKGAYSLTTYQKGAWVLHMLRNMMIDGRTMSEARFKAMMRDFYETYRGKRATTLDFQRVVERHVGMSMDWFFQQWIDGNDVPTYTFAWKAEQDSAGFSTQIRIRQTDVPETFGMYVPLLIKFDQGESFVRVLVRGTSTEATLRLPARPKSIEFNPFESVLADVKTEAWN